MPEAIAFYTFSGLMLAAALCVVLSRQPVYSVLALLVAMFCLAALFVMLGAYFLAALQILLYAGAVLVLFLFVVMLLNLGPDPTSRSRLGVRFALGALAAFVIYSQVSAALTRTPMHTPIADSAAYPQARMSPEILRQKARDAQRPSGDPLPPIRSRVPSGSAREIGHELFTRYLLPFELTSFLILAAIIAAVTLAKGALKRP